MPKERYDSPLEQKKYNGHKLTLLADQTAAVTVTTIDFNVECSAIKILNLDNQKTLKYSVDGGSNYFSIPPFGTIDELYIARSLKIKASSGTMKYDLKYTEKR